MGRSKSIVKKQPYIRKEIYSIDEVYNAVKDGLFEEKKAFVDMDGDMIKANSQRYQTLGFEEILDPYWGRCLAKNL